MLVNNSVGWTSWSGWTSCSVTCGTGLQKRSRSCQNPMTSLINDSCSGDPTQFQTCTDKACEYY
ncbi:TSP1-like protein [Mya arenaria]|uniref:TSP1-like protein n=1 Tax=Mya arenaria TaxID=6604 RepID=A0ABY7EHB3_MYAAR|nr:TSP1-like protein [Mya arenaria]